MIENDLLTVLVWTLIWSYELISAMVIADFLTTLPQVHSCTNYSFVQGAMIGLKSYLEYRLLGCLSEFEY